MDGGTFPICRSPSGAPWKTNFPPVHKDQFINRSLKEAQMIRRSLFVTGILLLVATSVFATGAGVMMQGFYWNCPSPWYPTMQAQASALANVAGGYGIDRIWFPVAYKTASGQSSMGYDPFDYYDLGSYSQN